jgi:hypothetical protein
MDITIKMQAAWEEGGEATLKLLETDDTVDINKAAKEAKRLSNFLGNHLPAITIYWLINGLLRHVLSRDKRMDRGALTRYFKLMAQKEKELTICAVYAETLDSMVRLQQEAEEIRKAIEELEEMERLEMRS